MKRAIVRFFNAYGLREHLMLLKYNRFSFEPPKEPMLISAIDGRRNTQGLADRFKGIVSVYALSKAVGVPFRCVYTHPFALTDFLLPNKYDWRPNENELSESVRDVRFKILRKQPTLKRLLTLLPLKKQVRVYANVDYLDEINRLYGKNFIWGELFNELFTLTPELEDQLHSHLESIGAKYTACAFRFQSLLGDFKEYEQQPLSAKLQKELIERNTNVLRSISEKANMPVLVTSDSAIFLAEAGKIKNVYTIPGKIIHVDCVFDEKKEVYMKLFIDFFMLSRAQKVYSIGSKLMYPTEFPLYASKINNVPFERILIE